MMVVVYFAGGVNVDIPALTLSDPLQSSSPAFHGAAGLNLAAAVILIWRALKATVLQD
jgi:hypothetical protein